MTGIFLAFNPSLVRLAPLPVLREETSRDSFNPSLVRLALLPVHDREGVIIAFNPSLVRLAPAQRRL